MTIHSARQLKDKIRKLAGDKKVDAQILLRNYMMERFLERISLSAYSEKFILKGGILVTSMVGFAARATMDIDATVKGAPVNANEVQRIVGEIAAIDAEDCVTFAVNSVSDIMEDAEYPGIRVSMTAFMDGIKAPLKLDISTGDVITPHAVEYHYRLMFEERTIRLLAYNLETVLAEKLETVITRTTANTRMRDFYDIHILSSLYSTQISPAILSEALAATVHKRKHDHILNDAEKVLKELHDDLGMLTLWDVYRGKFSYAADISWYQALCSVRRLAISAGLQVSKPSIVEALHEPLPERGKTARHERDLER